MSSSVAAIIRAANNATGAKFRAWVLRCARFMAASVEIWMVLQELLCVLLQAHHHFLVNGDVEVDFNRLVGRLDLYGNAGRRRRGCGETREHGEVRSHSLHSW